MATSRQVLANRRNAGLSRGPKTASGKVRSKLNALRHGLAAQPSPPCSAEVEALAQALSAQFPTAFSADVRQVAQAQLDILRVRQVRAGILERSTALKDEPQLSAKAQDSVTQHIMQLPRLDRYERRALSKRDKKIRLLFK
jgi:hypothetical protein